MGHPGRTASVNRRIVHIAIQHEARKDRFKKIVKKVTGETVKLPKAASLIPGINKIGVDVLRQLDEAIMDIDSEDPNADDEDYKDDFANEFID